MTDSNMDFHELNVGHFASVIARACLSAEERLFARMDADLPMLGEFNR